MLNMMAYALSAAAAQAPATVPAASPERPSATTDANARGEIIAPAPASSNRTEAPQPAFKPINHDEDYSSFRTVRDTNLWTRLKYIPIAGKTYATLGGELRLRPEIRIGERWGRGPQDDNGNFQQRTRVWGDLHVEGVLRAFVDLEHATSSGLDSVVAPVRKDGSTSTRPSSKQAYPRARPSLQPASAARKSASATTPSSICEKERTRGAHSMFFG